MIATIIFIVLFDRGWHPVIVWYNKRNERENDMSKIEFKTGDLVSFRYRQPLHKTNDKRTGVVLNIRNVRKDPVKNRYYRWMDSLNGTFKRSGNLFTVKHADSSIQVYYEGRCFAAKKPNWFQHICFYFQAHWPQYFVMNGWNMKRIIKDMLPLLVDLTIYGCCIAVILTAAICGAVTLLQSVIKWTLEYYGLLYGLCGLRLDCMHLSFAWDTRKPLRGNDLQCARPAPRDVTSLIPTTYIYFNYSEIIPGISGLCYWQMTIHSIY